MKVPTFLIIGVQKAGTTSIYNYLNQHPQVYMSPVKETNFFEKDWSKVDPEIMKKKRKKIDTFEKYCQLFQDVTDEIAIGEASPNYLFHYQSSSEQILRYLPDVKLIAILRNPTDRAYSDYLMHRRDGISNKSLSEQIKTSAHKSFIIRKGFYYTPIKYYFDKFGRDKLKVYLYDDLSRNSVRFMQEMYQFIGVDNTFSVNTSKKAQVAQVPKNQLVNNLLRKKNPLRSFASSTLKYILPLDTRQKIRSSLINLNSQDKTKSPLSPEDRKQLVELYHEDILKLQDLIHKDLSSWLKV